MCKLTDRIKNTVPLILSFFGLTMFTYGYLSQQSHFTLPGLISISLGIVVLDLCIITEREKGPNKTIKKLIERMDKLPPEEDSPVIVE